MLGRVSPLEHDMVLKESFKHPGRDGVKIMFMELFDGELEEFFVRLV